MLNRRTFTTGIATAAIAGAAHALEVDDDEAIRAILRNRIDVEKRTIGMAVCVVTPKRSRIVTWGRERVGDSRPVSAGTVFEIGSITKVFTALLLADMVHRGDVALEDPVARHLSDDFHLPELDGRQITMADLATHTSALPKWPPFPGNPLSPAWIEAALRFTPENFKAWLAGLQLPRAPGSAWEYSNATGYTLLAMALAHRGGQPYETLVQARVIEPLGLKDTVFHPTAAMRSRLAEPHDPALSPAPPIELGIFAPAGALRSTPHDMARFAAAILPGSGSRISPLEQFLLSVRRPAQPIDGMQALGWEVRNAPAGPFMSKDGVTNGQAASMVFDPDNHLAIVTFSNTIPALRYSKPSGGGVGAADLAQHLLRPQIPLDGYNGTTY